MTSASNQMITRCPKCGTAFRVTPSQLQSAKGAVRCGSCLNVFKAQEFLVAPTPVNKPAAEQPAAATKPFVASKPGSTASTINAKPAESTTSNAYRVKPSATSSSANARVVDAPKPQVVATAIPSINKPAPSSQPTILSAIKPLVIDAPKPVAPAPEPKSTPKSKPVIRTINTSSLEPADDMLISDDMEDSKIESKSYDFDGFMDIDSTPKAEVSLFERKIRDKDMDEDSGSGADESWAEMLIDDEGDDTPYLGVAKSKTDEQLADEALSESYAVNTELDSTGSIDTAPSVFTATTTPGLVFSLIAEKEDKDGKNNDDFVLSNELANIPNKQGFSPISALDTPDPSLFETPDANLFETPEDNSDSDEPKRQVKTQPKIRAYDGSRSALLMNIIPAPIEFNAKRMRRWYQRKLWPSLSILALIAIVIQIAWFKFEYFSRVEPYRTGYLFLCPYLGCKVPTLVDPSRIVASNLVVREHPDTQGALAVDVMLVNGAAFDQPFPDLVLVFTDMNENQVASRRFIPKDYLGGELVGQELMPHNQKIYITLDLVDPGAEAVNYHIYIPR